MQIEITFRYIQYSTFFQQEKTGKTLSHINMIWKLLELTIYIEEAGFM